MNALQRTELMRQAKMISEAELNEDMSVFVLIKNGTQLAKVTTDEKLVDTFVGCHNYSIWGIWLNGKMQDVRNYRRTSNR